MPPVSDMSFILNDLLDLDVLGNEDISSELIEAVLEEAAKLASNSLAPLNFIGDQQGSVLKDGEVTTPEGFKQAYAEYRDGGWNAVPFSPEYGGQGLPWSLGFAIQEMWQGANMSFGLCPLLNQGAVEAISVYGTDAQKSLYLEKLVSGEWTGTMNLTEPQAGSDLSDMRTRALPQDDGTYKVSGQKIFITYGEHDMADNIIHLVLARLPDAPEGTRGISLFIVPKFLEDGTRNDVTCVSLEHKLGIHASPTCTMQYGDKGGAVGYLLGTENEGLKAMFTMMNNARLSVGLQGIAISERAYQKALQYAKERVQGVPVNAADKTSREIIHHPDIQRTLLTMKSLTQAGRTLCYYAAYHMDLAHKGDKTAQAIVDLLTPVVKSWCTDISVEVTSLGVQVHGGMGFVEETGAAQYYRDARILPIYEGTNGIQAADLVFRKLARDKGQAAFEWLKIQKSVVSDKKVLIALETLEKSTQTLLSKDLVDISGLSTYYLNLFGVVAGACLLEGSAHHANASPEKKQVKDFYLAHILPRAEAYASVLKQDDFSFSQIEISSL